MAFLKTTLLLILLISTSSFSDFVIEDLSNGKVVSSPSQTPKNNQFKEKSVWGTAFLNLAIPGSGHLYIKEYNRAIMYFSIDVVLLGGAIFSGVTSSKMYDNSQEFAKINSGTNSTRDRDDKYWSIIGNKGILTSDDYNWAMENNRDFDGRYLLAEDQWAWVSSDDRDTYSDMRDKAGYWNTASKLLIGGMVLNRIVSFIDGRVSANKYNRARGSFASIKFTPTYAIATKETALTFYYSF